MTIDWWTLGIQTVNVVILIWLLGRFFWRPVAAMIEQRRADGAADSGRGGGEAQPRRPPRSPRSSGRAPALRRNAKRSWPQPMQAAERARAARLAVVAKEAAALRSGGQGGDREGEGRGRQGLGRAGEPACGRDRSAPGCPSGRPGGARRLPGLAPRRRSGLCRTRCGRPWRRTASTLEAISADAARSGRPGSATGS